MIVRIERVAFRKMQFARRRSRIRRKLAREAALCSGGAGMKQEITAETVVAMLQEEGIADLPGDFSAEGNLFEAGMDSMAVMQLIVVIEERYGAVIEPSDAGRENLGTPAAMARLISSKIA